MRLLAGGELRRRAVLLDAAAGGTARALARRRHRTAEAHEHVHWEECGHEVVLHGDHVDYLHDGHRHARHGDHWDEHDPDHTDSELEESHR